MLGSNSIPTATKKRTENASDAPYGEEITHREVDPHAEHQQNHPDFGELLSQTRIGDKPGREGSNRDAGQEIAHEWRQLEAGGQQPQHKREAKSCGNDGNEGGLVRHRRLSRAGVGRR